MPNEFLPVSGCRGKRAEWIATQDARAFLFLNANLSRACTWNAALAVVGGHKEGSLGMLCSSAFTSGQKDRGKWK